MNETLKTAEDTYTVKINPKEIPDVYYEFVASSVRRYFENPDVKKNTR